MLVVTSYKLSFLHKFTCDSDSTAADISQDYSHQNATGMPESQE